MRKFIETKGVTEAFQEAALSRPIFPRKRKGVSECLIIMMQCQVEIRDKFLILGACAKGYSSLLICHCVCILSKCLVKVTCIIMQCT